MAHVESMCGCAGSRQWKPHRHRGFAGLRTIRQHIYRLLKRYELGGLDAVEPRSRRPASNPNSVPDDVITAIVELREKLVADGLDAGPLTLQWHLAQAGLAVPSTSTIRRILGHHGLITAQPRKRPKSSYQRFQADQPNECWQSDFTHWALADGSGVDILNWLDDHSRYLLSCTAYRRVAGPDVVADFTTTTQRYGLPASTLTDNGSVYTSRFTHGHHDFERLLASLGITEKTAIPDTLKPNAKSTLPPNPQTLAHTTHRRTTLAALQSLLHHFTVVYNTERSHRALPPGTTPHRPTTPPKAAPPTPPTATSASATTPSTNSANSPCATAATYTTSASAPPTPTHPYRSWSPPPPSP